MVISGEFEISLEVEFERELCFIFFFLGLVGVEGSVVVVWDAGPVKSSDSLLPAML